MIAVDLGKIEYDECLMLQNKLHSARVDRKIDDMILLLEHEPVITFGKSAGKDDLLVSEKELFKQGVNVRRVNRGGKIACHYPGQLVGYAIVDLKERGRDISLFVDNLLEIIIRTLSDFGVTAEKSSSLIGIWVDDCKIASLGIEVKKWVTMHGFSMNIIENKDLYSMFVPCGITNKGVTFLESYLDLPEKLDMTSIKDLLLKNTCEIFKEPVSRYDSFSSFMQEYSYLGL